MSRKSKEEIKEEPRSRVNQFIIECLFSKYFEEGDEIASPATFGGEARNEGVAEIPPAPCNDGVPQRV